MATPKRGVGQESAPFAAECRSRLTTGRKAAAENKAPHVCDYLLAQGASPDIITAAMLGLVEEVTRLLQSDPSLVSAVDEHGRTPLDAATLLDSFRASEPPHTATHDQVADLL